MCADSLVNKFSLEKQSIHLRSLLSCHEIQWFSLEDIQWFYGILIHALKYFGLGSS
jgi:hypothetical protein